MRFAMVGGGLAFITLLPTLVTCSGEGNIRLLENEVAAALKSCSYPSNEENTDNQRQRRSSNINYDINSEIYLYDLEKRIASDMRQQLYVVNPNNNDYEGHGVGDWNVTQTAVGLNNSNLDINYLNGTKRSEPLLSKGDSDQCLSQCVFANLQVVDSRGIPREAEIWNLVQSSVTSQQSRVALRDQIRACFQELQSEAEDNGCSYSNNLERCLILRFSDRKLDKQNNDNS